MPYIKRLNRAFYSQALNDLQKELKYNPGDLNYLITSICHFYLRKIKEKHKKLNYSDYNDIVGALECAKLEFYRRKVVAYEEEKIKQNGDL